MTKFEIYKGNYEFRFIAGKHGNGVFDIDLYTIDSYVWEGHSDMHLIEQFDTMEAAREAFNAIPVREYNEPVQLYIHKGATGDFFYLMQTEYDEDGELEQSDSVELKADTYVFSEEEDGE